MTFLPHSGVGPGVDVASFFARIRAKGGTVAESDADPQTGVRALRVTGDPLRADGVEGLVVYAVGNRMVRALAQTRDAHWTDRLGPPAHEGDGYSLWAWTNPRWSIEARLDPEAVALEAKFLDEAIAAGHLGEDYVAALYASL